MSMSTARQMGRLDEEKDSSTRSVLTRLNGTLIGTDDGPASIL